MLSIHNRVLAWRHVHLDTLFYVTINLYWKIASRVAVECSWNFLQDDIFPILTWQTDLDLWRWKVGNGDQENEINNLQMLVRIVLSRRQVSSHLLDIYESCWLDCGPSQHYLVELKRLVDHWPSGTLVSPDNVGWPHNQAKTCFLDKTIHRTALPTFVSRWSRFRHFPLSASP